MDSTLDKELLARLQKHRQEKEAMENPPPPKVVPKSRAYVNVPQVGVRTFSSEELESIRAQRKFPAGVGKKKAQAIEAEVLVDKQQLANQPPPESKKPKITEQDKDKLRQIMEHGHVLPPPPAPTAYVPLTERERKVRRFEEVVGEIEERKEFLRVMDSPEGKLLPCCKTPAEKAATERRISSEIQERIAEMKQLDHWLGANP